jgi:23S rRNA pseudouridine1911/1915/1917 synthase
MRHEDHDGAQPFDEDPGLRLTVEAECDAPRLDSFLRSIFLHISRSYITHVIKQGGATINGERCKPSATVRTGDYVVLDLPPLRPTDLVAQDIPLDVLYEDDYIIVINKQKGVPAHPASSFPEGTVVNALMFRFGDSLSGIGGELRPGIVHRLDKDTSGVMVIARNNTAHQTLSAQFNARTVDKHYMAIVHGKMRTERGAVDGPIGRDPKNRKRMKVVPKGGKDAVSEWTCEKEYTYFSVVDVHPHTGRTHQVRVHMKHIGHTLAGDQLYGGDNFRMGMRMDHPVRLAIQSALDMLQGQALHARSLAINHPRTGERLTFTAPPAPDMRRFIDFLDSGGELIPDSK